jgi:hypothetical protein
MSRYPKTRLFARLEPLDREGPNHYLNRLAISNQVFSIERLAAACSYSATLLSVETVSKQPGRARHVAAIAYHYANKVSRSWLKARSRCCPFCIDESHQAASVGWELRFADACPKHGCWLIDTCRCGAPLRLIRYRFERCCACNLRLSSVNTKPAPVAVVRLSELLTEMVCKPPGTALNQKDAAPPKRPEELELAELGRLVQTFGIYGDPHAPPRLLQRGIDSMELSWNITTLAAEVISRWPTAFSELMDWFRTENDDGSTFRFNQRFGRLYGHLTRSLVRNPRFAFVKDALALYINEHWPTTRIYSRPHSKLESHAARSWISVRVASQLLGISRARLDELSRSGALQVERRTTPKGRTLLAFSRKSVDGLAGTENHHVLYIKQAASRLGVSTAWLRKAQSMLLPGAFRAPNGSWRIPGADVERIEAMADQFEPRALNESVETSIKALMYRGSLSADSIARLVSRGLTHPKELPVGRLTGECGIRSWIVPRRLTDEFRNSLRAAQWRALGEDVITLPELAKRWFVRQDTIYILVRICALKKVRPRRGTYKGFVIAMSDVSRFESRYVLGRELAAEMKMSPRGLIKALHAHNIRPAFNMTQYAVLRCVYKRSRNLMQVLTNLSRRQKKENPARSVPDWAAMLGKKSAGRRYARANPDYELIQPLGFRSADGHSRIARPTEEQLNAFAYRSPESLRRAARAGEVLVPVGLDPAAEYVLKSAMRYWGAWFSLRYARMVEYPIDPDSVIRFIADHAGVADPSVFVHFPFLQPLVKASRQMPSEVEWLLRRDHYTRSGQSTAPFLFRRLRSLSLCHDAHGRLRGDPLGHRNPIRTGGVLSLLQETVPGSGDYIENLLRIPATIDVINAVVRACPNDVEGIRDRALVVVSWASCATRINQVLETTIQDVSKCSDGYRIILPLPKLHARSTQLATCVLRGQAADVLKAWLVELARAGFTTGPLFRLISKNEFRGRMHPVDFARFARARSKAAGLGEAIVSFVSRDLAMMGQCRRLGVAEIDKLNLYADPFA